jgi:hypothetical protein
VNTLSVQSAAGSHDPDRVGRIGWRQVQRQVKQDEFMVADRPQWM